MGNRLKIENRVENSGLSIVSKCDIFSATLVVQVASNWGGGEFQFKLKSIPGPCIVELR